MIAQPFTSSSPTTVLVTGGAGYLGSWIVKLLVDAGHRVHTTVRNLADKGHCSHLLQLAARTGKITLFEADLLSRGSFDEAMVGCEYVLHTASPFAIRGIKNAQRELIDPAVNGTTNVLEAVNRTPTVKRVVLTSSAAAIYCDAADLQKPRTAFTEADWNEGSSRRYQPYPYSKTLAEREAWRLVGQQHRWDLIALNPGFMLGPALNPQSPGVSQTIMRGYGDGTFKSGMIDVWYGVVDVRDVAQAHLNAAFSPHARARYIVSGRSASLMELAKILRQQFGDAYPIPTRKAPKLILWLLPSAFGLTRRYVTRNVGVPLALDNRKSVADLKATYRPLETTLREHFEQLFPPTRLAAIP